MTLRQWLDENPGASTSRRVSLLRRVATAYDLSQRNLPRPHGAINPSNILIAEDGTITIGSSEREGRDPYAAPAGYPASGRYVDRFAFAATAVHTITGHPLVTTDSGELDEHGLRSLLRATRRPFLARHLYAAMFRPADDDGWVDLRRWFDQPRRRARWVGMLTLAVMLVTSVWAAYSGPAKPALAADRTAPLTLGGGSIKGPSAPRAGGPTPSRSAKAGVPRAAEPAAVTADALHFSFLGWPFSPGCDPVSQVAIPAGGPALGGLTSQLDPRVELIARGAGAWRAGAVAFGVTNTDTRKIRLLSVDVTSRAVPAPSWVFYPAPPPVRSADAAVMCGGGGTITTPGRHVAFTQFGLLNALDAAPLGPRSLPVPVSAQLPVLWPGDSSEITVAANSCRGNYAWQISVRFEALGSKVVRTYRLPRTFLSYGAGSNTALDYGYRNAYGGVTLLNATRLTGGSCAVGAPDTWPAVASPIPSPTTSAATAGPSGSPDATNTPQPAASATPTSTSAPS